MPLVYSRFPYRLRRIVTLALVALAAVLFVPAWGQVRSGRQFALLIGVNEYDSDKFRPLKFTENDVEELATVLASKRVGFDSVRVLTCTRGNKTKTNRPTAANVRTAYQQMLKGCKRNDTVLVALAGHGLQMKVSGVDQSFFCPADAQMNDVDSLVSLKRLFDDLDACGAGVKLLLVDACRNEVSSRRNLDVDAMPKPARGIAALFSCSTGESAYEMRKLGAKGHGVFTYFVVEGLRGKAARRKDGSVTWSDLTDYVTENVADQVPVLVGENEAKQTPHLVANLTGKSPVLVRPGDRILREVNNKVRERGGKEVLTSIGMKLVHIPAGKFLMGSPTDEQDRDPDEHQHEVEITRPFYLGAHEVTQKEYQTIMGKSPSHYSSEGGGKEKVKDLDTADFPVERVSWDEAVEFCKRLSALPRERAAGHVYRLPSEAEWEYACRGGAASSTPYHVGTSLSATQANIGTSKLGRPCTVGSYRANAFGLHDMHGNVWEWTADWYDGDYYKNSPRLDPPGPATGRLRVIRGGSYNFTGWGCRSAGRGRWDPDARLTNLGFRVAMVPAKK